MNPTEIENRIQEKFNPLIQQVRKMNLEHCKQVEQMNLSLKIGKVKLTALVEKITPS